jgi:hypothetical protein
MNEQAIEQVDPETGEIVGTNAQIAFEKLPELSVVSAEINQQIATSHRYPRRKDRGIAQEIVERATLNEEIAAECFYKLSRSGGGEKKDIIGPSIRLAEIVRAAYGNIRVASRYIGVDDKDKTRCAVLVEAVAMDMQTNDAVLMHVRRPIMTSPKNGPPRMFSADMINVTIMAAQSIAQRDAIFRLVPKALWIDGYHAALDTTRGSVETLAARRQKVIAAFAGFGIKPEKLFEALGIDSEQEIGLDDMVGLAGMWTSLKEGESVDSVLGRAMEAHRPAESEPKRNPLADRPTGPAVVQTDIKAQAHALEPSKTVTSEAEKIDMASGPRAEAQDKREAEAAVQQRTAPKSEPAPGKNAILGGSVYLDAALLTIKSASSATMLRDWRKRDRPAREAAQLSVEQLDALDAAFDAKLDQLRGG